MSAPDASARSSSLLPWAQLVRLPNVFTVIADVAAAFLLVASGPVPGVRFALAVLAGISLYWAGMILNDLFDLEKDRQQRPHRPLVSGRIKLGPARVAGWTLLALGVVLAVLSGQIPAAGLPANWIPGGVGVLLALMIVSYNGPLKSTPAAPVAMGVCRMLSFLLGATAALPAEEVVAGQLIPRYLMGIALGFGIYIMGITTVARREAIGDRRINLVTGLFVTAMGAAMLAFAPQLAAPRPAWHLPTGTVFPLLIFLIVAPVLMRELRILWTPDPASIQNTVKIGILTIIPLAAAFAFLGAGPIWGFTIFLLVVPSLVLAKRFRVT